MTVFLTALEYFSWNLKETGNAIGSEGSGQFERASTDLPKKSFEAVAGLMEGVGNGRDDDSAGSLLGSMGASGDTIRQV